ncbi:MAG: glycosyltransferase family 4 protein [Candidatus Dormiibacterota bacterium]
MSTSAERPAEATPGAHPAPPAPSDRGRILIVSNHGYPKDSVTRRKVDHLVEQGWAVDLICSGEASDARLGFAPDGLRVIRVPVRHRRRSAIDYLFAYVTFTAASVALSSLLTLRHAYTTAMVENPPDLLVLAALPARLRGARVVLNVVELEPELAAARLGVGDRHPVVRLSRWCERLAIRLSDHVITVSETCLRALRARGLDSAKATIVPNSVVTRVEWNGDRRPQERRPYLITHASLIERYGVQVAIRAMVRLRHRWPELTLRVLGEGEYAPELRRLARQLGIEDDVRFDGFLPWEEAMHQVRGAVLGLVPVIADGYGELMLPTKLLEYVEQGIPVVCSRLPAVEDYFAFDALAYFTPGDPVDLADRVDRLLRDPERAQSQAARARIAGQRLSWGSVSDAYVHAVVPGHQAPNGAPASETSTTR